MMEGVRYHLCIAIQYDVGQILLNWYAISAIGIGMNCSMPNLFGIVLESMGIKEKLTNSQLPIQLKAET